MIEKFFEFLLIFGFINLAKFIYQKEPRIEKVINKLLPLAIFMYVFGRICIALLSFVVSVFPN